MPTYDTYIVVQGDGEEETIDIEVTYEITKAYKGRSDKYGAKLEPDEPASIEIINAVRQDNRQTIDLTKEQEEEITSEIFNNLE